MALVGRRLAQYLRDLVPVRTEIDDVADDQRGGGYGDEDRDGGEKARERLHHHARAASPERDASQALRPRSRKVAASRTTDKALTSGVTPNFIIE
jgi:hypothetical protein